MEDLLNKEPVKRVSQKLKDFDKNLNGAKIKSVNIWKVTQSSPRIDNKLYRRPITKTILGEKTKWTK